jgi:hypothetical protein
MEGCGSSVERRIEDFHHGKGSSCISIICWEIPGHQLEGEGSSVIHIKYNLDDLENMVSCLFDGRANYDTN